MHQGRVHKDEKLRGREGLKVGVCNKINQNLSLTTFHKLTAPTQFLGLISRHIYVHASK